MAYSQEVRALATFANESAVAYASYVRFNSIDKRHITVKAATVDGYLTAVSRLLHLRFGLPDMRLLHNTIYRYTEYTKVLKGFAKRDDMRTLKSPFALSHVEAWLSVHAPDRTLPLPPLVLWAVVALYLGLRASEFLRTRHGMKRQRRLSRAFGIASEDVTFWDSRGCILSGAFADCGVWEVRIRFMYQKNGANGQIRALKRNNAGRFCPVLLFLQAWRRARFLGHSMSLPLAVDASGTHITAAAMAVFIREAVLAFDPRTPPASLALFTAHSFRVGALLRLLQAGLIALPLIVEFLRWRSESYILYLRIASADFSQLSESQIKEIERDFVSDACVDGSESEDDADL